MVLFRAGLDLHIDLLSTIVPHKCGRHLDCEQGSGCLFHLAEVAPLGTNHFQTWKASEISFVKGLSTHVFTQLHIGNVRMS